MVLLRIGVDVMSEQYFTRPNVQPVITNIGTTPEQRQMSTSEFKAKFDEMPEAIQQYIKETLLAELDAFKEEFVTHQAESASKHITESGSNENGSYIKFDDGTLICFKKDFINQSFEHNTGLRTIWTFPATFISCVVIPSPRAFGTSIDVATGINAKCTSDDPKTSAFITIKNTFGSTLTLQCDVFAIGRWK